MVRVMVIGNAAGGKSTMCRAICAAHDLPYHAIDQIQWQPGWVPVPGDTYLRAHDAILRQDRWLIDGFGSWDTVLTRLEACDTVIFVDHPIAVHFWWATKRQIKSLFAGRSDGPPGCPMWPVTIRLFRMMWGLHRETLPRLPRAIETHASSARLIHITSPARLNAFAQNPV